jgi:hypothetical protein
VDVAAEDEPADGEDADADATGGGGLGEAEEVVAETGEGDPELGELRLWSNARIVEAGAAVTSQGWRRHLGFILDGLREPLHRASTP